MSKPVSKYWRELSDELSANWRLRVGAWLIVLILALGFGLQTQDWHLALQKQKSSVLGRLEHVRVVAAEKDWPERASTAEVQMQALQARVQKAETRGLAQATLQSWGDKLLSEHRVTDGRHEVAGEPELDAATGLWIFRGRLRGVFDAQHFPRVLHNLEAHPQMAVVIERLDVIPAAEGAGRFELVYRMLYAISKTDGGAV